MDKVTRDMCVEQLKAADKHPDKPELLRSALVASMIAVVDCQYSTGKRIKRIVAAIAIIAAVLVYDIMFGSQETIRAVNFVRGAS